MLSMFRVCHIWVIQLSTSYSQVNSVHLHHENWKKRESSTTPQICDLAVMGWRIASATCFEHMFFNDILLSKIPCCMALESQ